MTLRNVVFLSPPPTSSTIGRCMRPFGQANLRVYSPLVRTAICAVILLLLIDCGGTDRRPFPYFDRVEVVAGASSVDIPPAQSKSDIAKNVPKEAAVGVALGTGTGLGLSLICGPAFAECAGVIVPLLAGPQLVDAPVGRGIAIITGMSREEADQVSSVRRLGPVVQI